MEFALNEGRWISHIHGRFSRQLEIKVRSLTNLEEATDIRQLEVEKALSIVAERVKLAETMISPLAEEWRKDHIKSTSSDVISSFGQAITKWNPSTLNGKFKQIQKRCQAHFRLLRQALNLASDSFTIDASINRIDTLIEELGQPLDRLTPRALSHLLLHMVPRQQVGRGDRSPYVDIGAGSTRGNKAEPDMSSPFDYLERDIKLGRRRTGDDRIDFITERIARVVRVLKYQGDDAPEYVQKCYSEVIDRFRISDVSLEEVVSSANEKLSDASPSERDELSIELIRVFIDNYVYKEEQTF
jgi:hypothetical protein